MDRIQRPGLDASPGACTDDDGESLTPQCVRSARRMPRWKLIPVSRAFSPPRWGVSDPRCWHHMQNGRPWWLQGDRTQTKTNRTQYPCWVLTHGGGLRRERVPTASLTSSCIPHVLCSPAQGGHLPWPCPFATHRSHRQRGRRPLWPAAPPPRPSGHCAQPRAGAWGRTQSVSRDVCVCDVPRGQPASSRGSK